MSLELELFSVNFFQFVLILQNESSIFTRKMSISKSSLHIFSVKSQLWKIAKLTERFKLCIMEIHQLIPKSKSKFGFRIFSRENTLIIFAKSKQTLRSFCQFAIFQNLYFTEKNMYNASRNGYFTRKK